MNHWGWYWRIKKQHKPKALCSRLIFSEIDSFNMFKNKELVRLVKESKDRICLIIPRYNLTATMQDDNSLIVNFDNGSYIIPVEKKACNYGGFYHFFHCPRCQARMRKLYCIEGAYLCRKCANLGYYSQRLRPSERCAEMSYNVMRYLKNQAGSLDQKPPWMTQREFQKLRRKFVKYDEKRFHQLNKELRARYGSKFETDFTDYYIPPDNVYDAQVERDENF